MRREPTLAGVDRVLRSGGLGFLRFTSKTPQSSQSSLSANSVTAVIQWGKNSLANTMPALVRLVKAGY